MAGMGVSYTDQVERYLIIGMPGTDTGKGKDNLARPFKISQQLFHNGPD